MSLSKFRRNPCLSEILAVALRLLHAIGRKGVVPKPEHRLPPKGFRQVSLRLGELLERRCDFISDGGGVHLGGVI